MGKSLVFIAIAAIFAIPTFAQDTISMKNGTREEANVLEIDETTVRYKKFNNPEGPTYSVKKETISEIRYKNGSKEIFNQAKATSPDKNPNSVWWTKARETKLGFWMDPLGLAQWGPMVGVVIRMGTNFDIKAHVRVYFHDFPIADAFEHYDNGVGLGLEFNKLFATTHGNWHAGLLLETATLEAEGDYYRRKEERTWHLNQNTIALTGGYTLRFHNRFFIDFSLQAGASFEYTDVVKQYFYGDASMKLGLEL